MWHEARRQERKIRGMLVDYRRRAERRRDFYEKIKADPTQFMQVHGRQCKIYLDPTVAATADSSTAMMPWQGQADNLIDRFDVRAHLDYIPAVKKQEESEELTYEERQTNYERYRVIAQNNFLGIQEEKFLKQLQLEEQFGYTEPESKKKKCGGGGGGVSIGFNYEEGTAPVSLAPLPEESEEENSDSDLDVDLYINVSKIDQQQAHEMNKHGLSYGMNTNDFYSFLTNDMEEAESNRLAREEEHEKALFSGRKSRRERRAHRERRLANRVISPPSYAARSSPTYPSLSDNKSPSHSPSPENAGKITYITSFGDEDEPPSTSKPTYAGKMKYEKKGKSFNRRSSPDHRGLDRRRRKSSSSDDSSRYHRRGSNSRRRSASKEKRFKNDRYHRSNDYKRRNRSRKSPSTSSSSSERVTSSKRKTKKSTSKSRSSSRNSCSIKSDSSTSTAMKKNDENNAPVNEESPPKILPRYYGRKRSDQSSSDFEDKSDKDASENKLLSNSLSCDNRVGSGNSGSSFKKTSSAPVLSLQERLKRKRQALLNKQFKADKLAEQIKTEREKQEQQNREDELREMAIRLRKRQREIRHAYDSHNSSDASDSDSKKSRSSNSGGHQRSRSVSPKDRNKVRSRDNGNEGKSSASRSSSKKRTVVNSDSEQERDYRRRRNDSRRSISRKESRRRHDHDEQIGEYKRNDTYYRYGEDHRRSDYKRENSRRGDDYQKKPLVDY